MKYKAENTKTGQSSTHANWRSAFKAAKAMGDPDDIVITERDRDGEREYNVEGKRLRENGHYE